MKRRRFLVDILFAGGVLAAATWIAQGTRYSVPMAPVRMTVIPALAGQAPGIKPATASWICQKGTPFRAEPGRNWPVIRRLKQWEEVVWFQEMENWDQIGLRDGSRGWVQSKYVQFARPEGEDDNAFGSQPRIVGKVVPH